MSSECRCYLNVWCFYCEMYSPLERERDEYKRALEKMDDRKNSKMPRSQMARLAIVALDKFKEEEQT